MSRSCHIFSGLSLYFHFQLIVNSNDGYVNSANGNSFGDDRQTTWSDLYRKQDEVTKSSPHLKGIVHSQSEGSLAFRSIPNVIDTSGFHPVGSKHKDIFAKPGQGVDISLRSPPRGRTTSRTPSPVKYLDDVPEEQAVDLTPSSAKRARSPIKKMFGENGWLGRSTSMKELPTDPSRKTGLKNWGGKIKQRVEDLVRVLTLWSIGWVIAYIRADRRFHQAHAKSFHP